MKCFENVVSLVIALILLACPGFAAVESRLDVITLYGRDFLPDYADINPSELKFFRYDAERDSWQIISSQVDEVGNNGYFYSNPPQSLSSSDEVLFLAKDAGDPAPISAWIPNESSFNYPRFQVTIFDTTGDKGYIYGFRVVDAGMLEEPPDYIDYRYNSSTDTDSIVSRYYSCGFNTDGLWTSVSIPLTAAGNGGDFLDRLKFHAQIDLKYGALSSNNFGISENFIKKANPSASAKCIDGKIRVIKLWETKINTGIPLFPEFSLTPFTMRYYPYYNDFVFNFPTKITGSEVEIKKIDLIRMSVDMDPGQSNMKMFTENDLFGHPNGVNINQIDEGIEWGPLNDVVRTLDMYAWNWWMQTGLAGTVLTIAYLQPILNVNGFLYYMDGAKGTNDGPNINLGDTGGGGSWGDTGVKYLDMTPSSQGGNVSLALRFYFLGASVTPDSARSLRNQTAKKLTTIVSVQGEIVPVELAAFTAKSRENEVVLNWQTATETNNLGFVVERKRTGSDWLNVGYVKGHGTVVSPHQYSFTQNELELGRYEYRLKQLDSDGSFHYSPVVAVEVTAPKEMALQQNYPNPFNPRTTIPLRIPGTVKDGVSLTIYDMLGRKVRTLLAGAVQPGYHKIEWDGLDEFGRATSSGVYISVLTDGERRWLKKLIKVQ